MAIKFKNTLKRKVGVNTPGGIVVLKPGETGTYDDVLNRSALISAGLSIPERDVDAADDDGKVAEAEAKAKAEAEAKAKADADAAKKAAEAAKK